MSTEPNSEFLPRLRHPKFPDSDTKGEFLPRLRIPKIPDEPPQPEPQPFVRALEGNYHPCDYPEDAAHENGNYATKCQCGAVFIGHKRRMICKVCAGTPPPQPEPPVWATPPGCPRCGRPLSEVDPALNPLGDWMCLADHDGKTIWFNYELTMILRSKSPIPSEPQQSAVEWVIERIRQECPINDTCVLSQDVLELARRCDEAEAQLAAAQAEAARPREALGWYAGELRFCNSMSREGDESRDRLAKDRGNRAIAALAQKEDAR